MIFDFRDVLRARSLPMAFSGFRVASSGKSPAVTYTRARPGDKPVLFRKLLREHLNFLSPYTCDVETSIVVARDASSGELVGCAKMGRMDGDTYQLSSVLVDEAYRGVGIGKTLIRQALELEPAEATVFLTTLEDRQDLYRKFGFAVCDLDKDAVPSSLKLEIAVGAALFSVTNLIVMRRN